MLVNIIYNIERAIIFRTMIERGALIGSTSNMSIPTHLDYVLHLCSKQFTENYNYGKGKPLKLETLKSALSLSKVELNKLAIVMSKLEAESMWGPYRLSIS